MHAQDFYKCFSKRLKDYLSLNHIKFLNSGVHPNGRKYWIYPVTDELSALLSDYSRVYKRV